MTWIAANGFAELKCWITHLLPQESEFYKLMYTRQHPYALWTIPERSYLLAMENSRRHVAMQGIPLYDTWVLLL
jgi:hypothetical protein